MANTAETIASLNTAIDQQNRLDDILKRINQQFDLQIDIHEHLRPKPIHLSSSLSKTQINPIGLQHFLSRPPSNPQHQVWQRSTLPSDSEHNTNQSIFIFARYSDSFDEHVVVVMNATPVVYHNYHGEKINWKDYLKKQDFLK